MTSKQLLRRAGLVTLLTSAAAAPATTHGEPDMPRHKRHQGVAATHESAHAALRSVPLSAVRMGDGFWKARMERNRKAGIPRLLALLEEHGAVENFRVAAGLSSAERRGPYFSDSDLFKWMEGAAYVVHLYPDDPTAAELQRVVDDVVAAQCDDGYLNTFFIKDIADQRFRNLMAEHEFYCAGHLIHAACAHYRATGSTKLLDAARRYADYLCSVFGPDKRYGRSGHEELEAAMVELYRTTGDGKYLHFAGYLLDGLEFHNRSELRGHAVRQGYFCMGGADYYVETGDAQYWDTLTRLFDDLVRRKMYITGGMGAQQHHEAFGAAYQLPNATAYAETCAAISNVLWNRRMLLAEPNCRYADVLERALYNGVLSGVSLSGDEYFYVNPLASSGGHKRQPWFGCTCCPTNMVRTLASIPSYLYDVSDGGVWVHLYDNSTLSWQLPDGRALTLQQQTGYPWDGRVEMTVTPQAASEFSVFLRIPGWCRKARLEVNGKAVADVRCGTYKEIRREWKPGDTLALQMDMPAEIVESHPRVPENRGCVAIQRGPVVYCIESPDNPGLPIEDARLATASPAELSARHEPDLLGGVTVITGPGLAPAGVLDELPLYAPVGTYDRAARMREVRLRAIPYYAWANRGDSHMKIWLPLGSQ